jgi:hypothetical protein
MGSPMLDNRPPEPVDSSFSSGWLVVGIWVCSSFFDILKWVYSFLAPNLVVRSGGI